MSDTNMAYAFFFIFPMAGAGLGIFYFYGLWLTVKKLAVIGNPARLLFWSAVCRLCCIFLILFLAARVNPLLCIFMLIGFLAGRYLIMRRMAA